MIRDLLSALVGKADAARSAPGGGVLDTLEGDHAELRMLLDGIVEEGSEPCSLDALEYRRELFARIRVAFVAHLRAELQEVYPHLRDVETLAPMVAGAEEEHAALEAGIERLAVLPFTDDEWMTTFDALRVSIVEHLATEEGTVFAEIRRAVPPERLRDMDAAFRRARRVMEESLERPMISIVADPTAA